MPTLCTCKHGEPSLALCEVLPGGNNLLPTGPGCCPIRRQSSIARSQIPNASFPLLREKHQTLARKNEHKLHVILIPFRPSIYFNESRNPGLLGLLVLFHSLRRFLSSRLNVSRHRSKSQPRSHTFQQLENDRLLFSSSTLASPTSYLIADPQYSALLSRPSIATLPPSPDLVPKRELHIQRCFPYHR